MVGDLIVRPAQLIRMSTGPRRGGDRVVQGLQRGAVADVGRLAHRPDPHRLDLGADRVDQLGAASGRDDVGAGLGEADRQRPADARRSSDDDGGLAVECDA